MARRDGTLDVTRMSALVDQIADLNKSGVEIILISSGAVASGRSEIYPQKKLDSVDPVSVSYTHLNHCEFFHGVIRYYVLP